MEITNLKNAPEYFEETIKLIEKCFHYDPKYKFTTDFYPLISNRNWHNCYIVIDNNHVVAHIGVKPRTLKDGTPIALIGGVVVDESLRGNGIFSQLFNVVLDQIKKDFAFVILWSELSDMYQKFDFVECGAVIQTGTKTFSPQMNFEKTNMSSLNQEEFLQIQKLYQKSYHVIYRNINDWNEIAQITSTDLYIHKTDGIIDAYMFVNKGMDLGDIIHEVCFDQNLEEEILETFAPYQLWLPEKYENNFHTRKLFSGIYKVLSQSLYSQFLANHNISHDLKINDVVGPGGKLASFYISGLDSV